MSQDAPILKIKIQVAGVDIILDPDNMRYNETNLGDYMSREYGWIDYLGKQLEFAQKELLLAEIDAETVYSKKFLEAKDDGKTDTCSKAYANSCEDFVIAKKKVIDRKEAVGHLKAHLRAWDKNHDNVQNRGHTLRKEMDVLNREVYLDQSVEDVIGKIE
jgi:hypothetical protein